MKLRGDKWHLDQWLIDNLDHCKKRNEKQDLDTVILITGQEGTGKSTLAGQIAYYLDDKTTLEQVKYNIIDFGNLLLESEDGKVCILDEGDEISGSNWSNKQVKWIISILKRVRKKNLYIIICTPQFFQMSSYLIDRCNILLNCKFAQNNVRIFEFYNRPKVQTLYKYRRSKGWFGTKRNFWARYTKWMPWDKEEYEKQKDEGIMKMATVALTRDKHTRASLVNTSTK